MIDSNDIIRDLEKRLGSISQDSKTIHVGEVVKNSDGIITASGLSEVTMGEMVELDKG